MSYHHLGRIAQEQRNFATAETWYRKTLHIDKMKGNEHGAAKTYSQLAILMGLQENFEEAGKWLIKGMFVFLRFNDNHADKIATKWFMKFYNQSPPEIQQRLKNMWEESLGEFPDPAKNE